MTGCDPNADVVHQFMGSRKLGMTYLIMRNWQRLSRWLVRVLYDLEIEGEKKTFDVSENLHQQSFHWMQQDLFHNFCFCVRSLHDLEWNDKKSNDTTLIARTPRLTFKMTQRINESWWTYDDFLNFGLAPSSSLWTLLLLNHYDIKQILNFSHETDVQLIQDWIEIILLHGE